MVRAKSLIHHCALTVGEMHMQVYILLVKPWEKWLQITWYQMQGKGSSIYNFMINEL